MTAFCLRLMFILICLALCQPARCGTACDQWTPGFGPTPLGGTGPMVTFDDGSGPSLFAVGNFAQSGGVFTSKVGKWNGEHWAPAGDNSFMFHGSVYDLAVYDDGSGPALYAGGSFYGVASNVAKWDGTSWSPLGTGTNGVVYKLTVYDDGSGPALYAGGLFTSAGSAGASNIAKWDGSSWSGLGAGLSDYVTELQVFNDGNGEALYVGGFFHTAGGVTAHRIARWDGNVWSSLGSSGGPLAYPPLGLAAFDDGTGEALYVFGDYSFFPPGISNVAKWDGASWSPVGYLGNGLISPIDLTVLDDGTGEALYAIGGGGISRWNGTGWAYYAGASSGGLVVQSFCVFDDGMGSAVYASYGGVLGGVQSTGTAKWDGSQWSALTEGMSAFVYAMETFDDGMGEALYVSAAGFVGGHAIDSVVKWDGSAWNSMNGYLGIAVYDLLGTDLGDGRALYAAGRGPLGSAYGGWVVKWNGTSWIPIGGVLGEVVYALEVYDDGTGPALYAGGRFTSAGGVPANNIAKWDGVAWVPLGQGVGFHHLDRVSALAVFDDGSGESLFVGGRFNTAGGTPAAAIARWNGANWSAVGTEPWQGSLSASVGNLVVFDNGAGPKLVANSSGAWTWNGSNWSTLGGAPNVGAMAVVARTLYAARTFTSGGQAISELLRWDGVSWHSMGETVGGYIYALTAVERGPVSSIYVGGSYEAIAGVQTSCVAEWVACDSGPVWYDLGSGLPGANGIPHLSGAGSLLGGSSGSLTVTGAMPSAPSVLFVSVTSTPVSFMGGSLVAYPVVLAVNLMMSGSGSVALPFTWPSGIPANFSMYMQLAVADPGAPNGVALTNALKAVTP